MEVAPMLPSKTRAWIAGLFAAVAVTPALALAAPVIEVGKPFPEIALPSLADGRMTSIADYRGRRVILHVFASW
jgi:hypothetical protein